MFQRWLFGLIGIGLSFAAQSAPMNIYVEPYTKIDELVGGSVQIFLSGEISKDTPAKVQGIIAANQAFGRSISIIINSPGGNLFAGMELGRVLREAGASVTIGSYAKDPKSGKPDTATPGVCLSACALAYIGGTNRWIRDKSVYGVHRFHSQAGASASDLDTAQIISAAIGNYIREMGISPALFDLMVQVGADKIYPLSPKQLTDLKVVNNGRQPADWSIVVVDGATYLRGSQTSYYGLGKSMFACLDGGQVMYSAMYTAGDNAQFIAKGGWYHSLFLDNETIPLDPPAKLANDNGTVSAFFALPASLSARIANARNRIGHAMQLSREAPTFVGYHVDLTADGQQKLRAFLGNCIRGIR